jgi:hypothetical protein
MKVMDGYLKVWATKPTPYVGYSTLAYSTPWATVLALKEIIGTAIDKGLPLTGDNLVKIARELPSIDMGGLYGPNPVKFVQSRVPYGIIFRFHVKPDSFSITRETDFIKIAD